MMVVVVVVLVLVVLLEGVVLVLVLVLVVVVVTPWSSNILKLGSRNVLRFSPLLPASLLCELAGAHPCQVQDVWASQGHGAQVGAG